MKYEIKLLDSFKKDFKTLATRYKNIKNDIKYLGSQLQDNPKLGKLLKKHCYKIRVPNSSTSSGKSGGFRVIYYYVNDSNVYFISIYSKTKKDNIDDNKILELLKINGLTNIKNA